VTDYTFDPAAHTVTSTGYAAVDLKGLIIITNVTRNIIIYSYADMESPYSLGGSAATNVVTLDYDTTKMLAADELQIYYDDGTYESIGRLDKRLDYDVEGNIIYLGTHSDVIASEDDLFWYISKFGYDVLGNITRIQGPLTGSWTGRAGLGWS
jgi:hypothetical protein